VAIVSLPAARASGDRYVATYPFCAHSPEYVALAWAVRSGARAAFIDLPARHPDMRRDGREGEPQPAPLIGEWRLDHNAYVAELCARRGMADPLALWDALFESRLGAADWRGFFASVGLYCRHIRETTAAEDMAVDGTLAREAHMADRIRQARVDGPGPVAVIAGGFHIRALYKAVMAPGVPGFAAVCGSRARF
jgi:hypothetical protein